MQTQVDIVEKVVGQTERRAFSLRLATQRIVARDILALHVRQEVDRLNDQARRNHNAHDRVASFLVGSHAHAAQTRLNPRRRSAPKVLDPETEIATAIDGIIARRIIMLFDDREVEDLDAELTFTDSSVVTFLRLMPLVGG